AKRFLARNRSLQNSPPTTNENRFPAPKTAGLCCPRKTSRTPSRQTHQTSFLPTIRSLGHKTDVLAPSRFPAVRSRSAVVAVFAAAFPFPSTGLRKSGSHSTESSEKEQLLQVTKAAFHHGLLDGSKTQEKVF